MIKKVVVALAIVCPFSLQGYDQHKIAIIGTGYVGLVTGACLADLDNDVCCVDIDESKINKLKQGIMPIYEPGLEELVIRNTGNGNLSFSTDIAGAIQQADIVFIGVGTPSLSDGHADLSAIDAVVEVIKSNLNGPKVICMKSTVPIGTCKQIAALVGAEYQDVIVLSNPEFLREGFAVYDFFNPARIVVGSEIPEQTEVMRSLYAPFLAKSIPMLCTDLVSAEAIKYVSNAFLAVKIAYVNEIAQLCSEVGANINAVTTGMGLDDRIGNKFLQPGPGYGGYCLPKDTIALVKKAEDVGITLRIVSSCIESNEYQKKYIVQKAAELCGDLSGKTITVWGLSFKANTDDVRESASIDIINEFLKIGATVKAYDPLAQENMKRIVPNVVYCETKEQALEGSDILVVLTEWAEFKNFDYSQLGDYMCKPRVVDTRDVIPMTLAKKNMSTIYKLGY